MEASKKIATKNLKVIRSADRESLRREFYKAIDDKAWDWRETIRRLRIFLGMNQKEFAKFAGVSPRIIMAIEQGGGNPTVGTLRKLLKGSGLDIRLDRSKGKRSE